MLTKTALFVFLISSLITLDSVRFFFFFYQRCSFYLDNDILLGKLLKNWNIIDITSYSPKN